MCLVWMRDPSVLIVVTRDYCSEDMDNNDDEHRDGGGESRNQSNSYTKQLYILFFSVSTPSWPMGCEALCKFNRQ